MSIEKYESDTIWLKKNLEAVTENEIDEFIQAVSILIYDMTYSENEARNHSLAILNKNRRRNEKSIYNRI